MPVFQKRKPRFALLSVCRSKEAASNVVRLSAQFNKTQTQDAFGLPTMWKRIPININQLLRSYVRITLRSGNA